MLDHFAESAKTLTLVAIIVQALFTGLFALYFSLFLGLLAMPLSGPGMGANFGFAIVGVIGIVFAVVGLTWIMLDYFLVYRRLLEENIRPAQDSSLILGIIQLIFGGIVPGILLIIAYTQLNNSSNRREYQKGM